MRCAPRLNLSKIYPTATRRGLNINTCGDPDCGNFGVEADASLFRPKGRGAMARLMASGSNAAAAGLGKYKLNNTDDAFNRVSTVFEYHHDPLQWNDRRHIQCQFKAGGAECGFGLELLSNDHLEAEIARLRDYSGVLDGPRCKACEQRYLAAPEEFVLNGAHGFKETGRDRGGVVRRPRRIRLIHKSCKGRPGGRFYAALDHLQQKESAQNVQILLALVNGAGINDLRRMLTPAGSGRVCGVKRVYDRIFWLERVLLAFEREQLRRWRERCAEAARPRIHHLAHDDIALGVNWETAEDRRLTQLNCATTADVWSGYVFRIDPDFDPTVDPAAFIVRAFGDPKDAPTNIREVYTRADGSSFTMPKMSFQRESGRFDEKHLFAAAHHQYRLFKDKLAASPAPSDPVAAAELARRLADADDSLRRINDLHHGYFDFAASERDNRTPFSGIMTRDIYTKAAHFALVQEMLPAGPIKLVTEMEGTLTRMLPHIFRDAIQRDDFTWIAMTFDKEATKPQRNARVAAFKRAFKNFLYILQARDPDAFEEMTASARLRAFVAENMATHVEYRQGGGHTLVQVPFPGSNFLVKSMPQVWVKSPLETAGEIGRIVGFPLPRASLRSNLRGVPFNTDVQSLDDDDRRRMARLVCDATLQPVSTFFNALRERVSPARRAGGKGARSGPSYVNGAVFNPRVLIALLNIFRVHYNFFELRPYVSGMKEEGDTEHVETGTRRIRVPGTDASIEVPKKSNRRPILRTPAMRLGIQEVPDQKKADDEDQSVMKNPSPPSLYRVLYRPWLYAGTPLWDRFENPKCDLRRNVRYRGRAAMEVDKGLGTHGSGRS